MLMKVGDFRRGQLSVNLSAIYGEGISISTASRIGQCAVNGYSMFMN